MDATNDGFVDISHDKDGGLLKKILVEGVGEECPPVGSAVEVHYVGTLEDGSKFDSSRDRPGNFKFDVGVGQVIKGWDQGICSMKKGEKCILRCTSDYAYGDHGSPPKIPPKATLNFEVELFSWKEKVKPPESMTPDERMAHAQKMKDEGTAAFKIQDWATAINRWEDGVEYSTYIDDEDDDAEAEARSKIGDENKTIAIAMLNNSAMAKLKMKDESSAKFDCKKVLDWDENNVKAIFRHAQADLALGNYAECAEYAARACTIDPQNKEAEQLRRKALDNEKRVKKNEKAMYSKMFG